MSQENTGTLGEKHENPPLSDTSSLGLPRELVEAVELMFFAYRDFVSDPDTILKSHGFGRAHHRVLHFVGRRPGMSVSELLHILSITKQSLSRVLKDLIEEKYIIQETDEQDRRIKRLLLSAKGQKLHRNLIDPQIRRFQESLAKSESGTLEKWQEFMLHLTNMETKIDFMDDTGREK
jgi:DNA-binding MarR family transcriptional regulator